MKPPQRNFNLKSLRSTLVRTGSTLISVLAGFSLWNLMAPRIPESSVRANNQDEFSISKELLGTWQLRDDVLDKGKLIFTPEGKLFIQTSPNTADQFTYKIDSNQQPKHLDVFQGEIHLSAIFEFTNDGGLRLLMSNSGAARPVSFDLGSFILQKKSDQTTLPPNFRVSQFFLDQLNKARQLEAKSFVDSLNKGQMAYFAEHNRFTNNIEEVGASLKTLVETYSYRVVIINEKRAVQIIGIAKKDGLRSYTGGAFALKDRKTDEISCYAILCESDRPSKQMALRPTVSGEYTDSELKCPVGYTQVLN